MRADFTRAEEIVEKDFLIEPLQNLPSGLVVARAENRVQDGKVLARMLNSTDEGIHLQPTQRVGLIEAIAAACLVSQWARLNSVAFNPNFKLEGFEVQTDGLTKVQCV